MSVCVLESWCLIQGHERSVMVAGIVGPAGVLLDHDPFRIPRTAAYFGIHIVLTIVAWGKAALAILELVPSDIAWQGFAIPGLELCQ